MQNKEVLKVPTVMDNQTIILKKKMNILIYSIIGGMGIFMGLFFIPYFLIKINLTLLSLNILALLFGILSLIFLYWYTGN